MRKFLLISVHPNYAYKIINGEKTIELRKNRPNIRIGDYVIIYATHPIMAIIGFGKVKNLIITSPDNMWENYSGKLGITKESFSQYYKETNKAIGIEIEAICKFEIGLMLKQVRKYHPNFTPPQTYKYISYFTALRSYKKLVTH